MFTYQKLIIILNLAAVLHAGNTKIPIYEQEDSQWNWEDTQAYTAKLCDTLNLPRPSDLENVKAEFYKPRLLSHFSIGTPPQPLKMCFDITSPDMRVRSSSCAGLLCVLLKFTAFIFEKSSSFINLGYSYLYEGKNRMFVDNLIIGGAVLKEQTFIEAAGSLPSYVDAWFGISQGESKSGYSTVLQNMFEKLKIDEFTVILQSYSDPKQVGEIYFGDVALAADYIITAPSNYITQWQILTTYDGIAHGAFLDFNSPDIIFDNIAHFNKLISESGAQIGKDNNYYVKSIKNISSLIFVIDDKPITVSPEAYFEPVGTVYKLKVRYVEGLFCLGAPFYSKKWITFNFKTNMISIAELSEREKI